MEKENYKMIKSQIEDMIRRLNKVTTSWLQESEDGFLYFMDPLDNVEISVHYGASHAATAWVIYGQKTGNKKLINNGKLLIQSILDRWKQSTKLLDYHYDFNNFALCVAYEYLKKNDTVLAERIKNTILSTPDSNNPTINWYPMRWYVNRMRYKWTGEKKYQQICETCRKTIRKATFIDGFIDDRIPKGKSFNLQYDIATVGVMQFLRTRGETLDITKELGALLNVVSPDGDINYLGRGTNQVFAWGLWIYLLMSSERDEVATAVTYLQERLQSMLNNQNMMLNEWSGIEKYMWWDYHYCSVYTAHLLFWLVLSIEDSNKAAVEPKLIEPEDSGIKVYRSNKCVVVTFAGRSEYLSERGSAVALVWTERDGILVKGYFAPWLGAFGNKYTFIDVTLRNYFGLLSVRLNADISKNRFIHKITSKLHTREKETIVPVFAPVKVEIEKHRLNIIIENSNRKSFLINLPFISKCSVICEVDGKVQTIFNTMKIRNQYDWVNVWQSRLIKGSMVKITLPL